MTEKKRREKNRKMKRKFDKSFVVPVMNNALKKIIKTFQIIIFLFCEINYDHLLF